MASLIINFALIKLIQLLVRFIPTNDYSTLTSFTSVSSHVVNIFAWANKFIPVDLILVLLTLTATLFFIKMFWKLITIISQVFKS